ncbi:MAG: HAD-IA family hydrolase [Acidimicrobiales bacterium]|nr:HAD-IA family hydrolase [Acidimicrobiales bacterium]
MRGDRLFDPEFWHSTPAVLFDLDGVITPTATVHERAWAALFNWFLHEHGDAAGDRRDFSLADYHTFVDGKPRYDGVRSFLASRGVQLPEGDPSDPPGPSTVCALGNRKNAEFNAIIARDGIAPYPGSDQLLNALDSLGVAQGIVSSSKNARPVLNGAGYEGRFEVIIDGVVAADLDLPGKPAPDAFLLGAERLGVHPSDTVVFEDAVSGVAAGSAGGFKLVVGVDRGTGADALLEHGADVVVRDLDEIVEAVLRAADRKP